MTGLYIYYPPGFKVNNSLRAFLCFHRKYQGMKKKNMSPKLGLFYLYVNSSIRSFFSRIYMHSGFIILNRRNFQYIFRFHIYSILISCHDLYYTFSRVCIINTSAHFFLQSIQTLFIVKISGDGNDNKSPILGLLGKTRKNQIMRHSNHP